MIDYDKAEQELAEVGFTPGCLVRAKKQKSFWLEQETSEFQQLRPVVERLKMDDGSYKEWARGKKPIMVPADSILMFLGLLTREVDKGVVDDDEGRIKVTSYGDYKLLCFLHEQKIVWWDYNSIDGGAPKLLEKFEVLNCGETEQETELA